MKSEDLKLLALSARLLWRMQEHNEKMVAGLLHKFSTLQADLRDWRQIEQLPDGPEKNARRAERERHEFEFDPQIYAEELQAVLSAFHTDRAKLLAALKAIEDRA